jgi:hypothetical protein
VNVFLGDARRKAVKFIVKVRYGSIVSANATHKAIVLQERGTHGFTVVPM